MTWTPSCTADASRHNTAAHQKTQQHHRSPKREPLAWSPASPKQESPSLHAVKALRRIESGLRITPKHSRLAYLPIRPGVVDQGSISLGQRPTTAVWGMWSNDSGCSTQSAITRPWWFSCGTSELNHSLVPTTHVRGDSSGCTTPP